MTKPASVVVAVPDPEVPWLPVHCTRSVCEVAVSPVLVNRVVL
jgi:hypothetical protein